MQELQFNVKHELVQHCAEVMVTIEVVRWTCVAVDPVMPTRGSVEVFCTCPDAVRLCTTNEPSPSPQANIKNSIFVMI